MMPDNKSQPTATHGCSQSPPAAEPTPKYSYNLGEGSNSAATIDRTSFLRYDASHRHIPSIARYIQPDYSGGTRPGLMKGSGNSAFSGKTPGASYEK